MSSDRYFNEGCNEENTLSSGNTYISSVLLCPKSNHNRIFYDECDSSDDEIGSDVKPEFEPIGTWGLYGINNKAWCDKYRPVVKFKMYDDLELTVLEKSGYLTDRIIASCSSYLEKCPKNKKLVLCKCILSNKILKNIEILRFHIYLQFLDLSYNYLQDVTVLQYLRYLMHLDVSSNNLSALLNFRAPHNLTYVNYSFNQIEEIPDLTEFWSIKYLYLQHNKITKISGLHNLRYMESLDLSYNKLEVIENLDHLNLFNLYLQNNRISTFVCDDKKGFKSMPYLSYVRLGNNELQSLKIFEHAVLLQSIEVQNNDINNLMEISHLSKLQMLSSINLDRNPIKNQENYEPLCLETMKNLKFLDGQPVYAMQKVHAQTVLHPNIKLEAVKIHDDLVSISHLSQFVNMGIDVIPADQPPRPIIIIIGPLGSKHEQLINTFVQQYEDRAIKLKNHIDREKHPGETPDAFYYLTREQFNKKLLNGEFLMVYNILKNYCGLSQEEFARGLKEVHKVMIINADIKAALAFRMRGYQPIIVLAMPQSEELHKEWIANEIFDFAMYNKSFPEAAVEVTPRENMTFYTSTISGKSNAEMNETFLNIEKMESQVLMGEEEPPNYNAHQFLQSCPEDYFIDYSKFQLFFDKVAGKGEEINNAQYYPIDLNYCDEQPSFLLSGNLIEMFQKRIIHSRNFYLEFHNTHPGIFYTTVYTDCLDKAVKRLKNITKAAMANHLTAETYNIEKELGGHTVTKERLRLYEKEIVIALKKKIVL